MLTNDTLSTFFIAWFYSFTFMEMCIYELAIQREWHEQCAKYELHRVILLYQRLRLTRVLRGPFSGAACGQRAKRFFLHRLSTATIYAFEQVSNVANSSLRQIHAATDFLWKSRFVCPLEALVSIQKTRQTQTSCEKYYSMQTHSWHSE
jgi:hypothetical protein